MSREPDDTQLDDAALEIAADMLGDGDDTAAGDASKPADDTTPEPKAGEAQEGADGGTEGDPLKETPYKTPADLVKGFKNLQRTVATKDREIAAMQGRLSELLNYVKTSRVAAKPKTEEDDEDPEQANTRMIEMFTRNPKKFLAGLKAEMRQEILGEISPRLETVTRQTMEHKINSVADAFSSGAKDMPEAYQQRLVEIIAEQKEFLKRAYPGDPQAQLQHALNAMIAEDPEGWTEYQRNRKASLGRSLTDAKSAAGFGGKKSSVTTTGNKTGDEFDDALNLWSERTASNAW